MPIALVTGATAGLGAEFARQLAAEGSDLVIVARNSDRLESTRTELQDRYRVTVETLGADLATAEGRAAVAARVRAEPRPIDLLVNNAGIGLHRAFGKTEIADEGRMLDINVRAVMELSHAAVATMRPRGAGIILNVASVAGFIPRPESVTYGATKAYVISFTEALSQLLAGTGVTASAVCPGFTHTEFHDRAQLDMSYLPAWMWLDATDVVAEALIAARAGKAVSVPSRKYQAIVALSRLAPRSLARRLGATGPSRPRR